MFFRFGVLTSAGTTDGIAALKVRTSAKGTSGEGEGIVSTDREPGTGWMSDIDLSPGSEK